LFILQAGPLSLNGPLLLSIWFGVVGYAVVRWSGVGGEERETVRSGLFGGGVVWLVTWKMSLLLLDPLGVLSNPSALLYLDGGTAGRYAATAVALGYAAFRWRASRRLLAAGLAAVALFAAAGTLALQLGYAALGRPEFAPTAAAAAALGVAAWFAVRQAWHRDVPLRRRATESAVWVAAAALLLGAAAEAADAFEARQRDAVAGVGHRAGQLAPDVALALPDGSPASLADFRGRPVLLNFWASWCPPCRAEMPSLQRLHESYADEGVVVLAVNLTSTERRPDAGERYLAEHAYSMPSASDVDGEAMGAFRVRAYPTSFAIDADGVIVGRYEGAMHFRAMAEEVERLLERGEAGSP
jgi:thiol-disulfide isomerase/thioredoxin